MSDLLTIAGNTYSSRLLIGTGKYKDFEETREAIETSGAEIVTVAIRRTNIGQNADEPNLLDFINPDKYTILPNTAGCFSAEDAVRCCKLARELLDGHDLVKLEVLGDQIRDGGAIQSQGIAVDGKLHDRDQTALNRDQASISQPMISAVPPSGVMAPIHF